MSPVRAWKASSVARQSVHPGTCSVEQTVGGLGVLAGERPQDVAREQLVDRLVVDHPVSWSATRSFRIAARVRVFTVPSGIASSSAICTWVLPSK